MTPPFPEIGFMLFVFCLFLLVPFVALVNITITFFRRCILDNKTVAYDRSSLFIILLCSAFLVLALIVNVLKKTIEFYFG